MVAIEQPMAAIIIVLLHHVQVNVVQDVLILAADGAMEQQEVVVINSIFPWTSSKQVVRNGQ